jgi:hypothetical protein
MRLRAQPACVTGSEQRREQRGRVDGRHVIAYLKARGKRQLSDLQVAVQCRRNHPAFYEPMWTCNPHAVNYPDHASSSYVRFRCPIYLFCLDLENQSSQGKWAFRNTYNMSLRMGARPASLFIVGKNISSIARNDCLRTHFDDWAMFPWSCVLPFVGTGSIHFRLMLVAKPPDSLRIAGVDDQVGRAMPG